ncbi:hypothetical protein PINS_up000195 [Pythium insidiosum]|nr:hypothetical protein PINS_up000195 [Pythium insidiosum]
MHLLTSLGRQATWLTSAATDPVFLKGFASACVADDATLSRFTPADVASLEAFASHHDTVVDLACKPKTGRCYSGDHRARQNVSVKFGDFLAYFRAAFEGSEHWLATVEDLDFYLCQCPIAVHKPDETCSDAVLPKVCELLKIPSALPIEVLTQINLWMTVHASQTSLHYDAYRNVLVVLHGKKSVTVYPPSDCGDLRANPVYSASANHSPVDVQRLKLGETLSTQGQTFCVGAGDALYIPEGWWHHVDSDPFTIAVNFWYEGLRDTITRDSRMTTYYARVAMQALLTEQISTTVRALHVSARSSRLATSQVTCTDIAAEVTQASRELAMLAIEGREFLAIQSSMATQLPQVWRSMLMHASIDFAGALAHCWESFSSEEELLAVIFSSLGDEEDEIKQQLLVKQEAFHHKIFKRTVATTLG